MIFITFLITAAKLNAVHEVEIILRDPEWFLQLPIKHMANTRSDRRAPDWLIGYEQTLEYCCDLSSLLTCCPLR